MTAVARRRRLSAAALALTLTTAATGSSSATFVDDGSVRSAFTTVAGVPALFTGVDAGDHYSVGWDADGDLFAWGNDARGQLGLGETGGTRRMPTRVTALADHHVVEAAAGIDHAIALTDDGGVWTWGNPDIAANTAVPQRVELFDRIPERVVGVDAGGYFYLAWTDSGSLYSWGRADHRIGRPSPGAHAEPALVTAQGLQNRVVTDAAAGRYHGVAVVDGGVVAWGQGYGGISGTTVGGVVGSATGVAAGTATTLVWTSEGRLFSASETATASPVPGLVPEVVVGGAVSAPAIGAASTWAWTAEGRLYAWGPNAAGMLGIGQVSGVALSPVAVPLPAGAVPHMVGAGADHALFQAGDGRYAAAGSNDRGQLGDGTTTGRTSFAIVIVMIRWP